MKEWFRRYRQSYDKVNFITDVLILIILALLAAGAV